VTRPPAAAEDRPATGEEPPEVAGPVWWRHRLVLDGAVPLAIYAANRILQLILVVALEHPDTTLVQRLTSWDADFFIRVARDGYDHGYQYDQSGHFIGNTLAFFPGYPALVRLVAFTGVPFPVAAVVASLLAGAVAVVLVHLLGSRLRDRRTGYVLAALFCGQPMAVVLSMGYSEALFCALVLAMLLALHRDNWLWAGAFGALAGLTRTTGLAAALALAGWAAWRLWSDRGLPHEPGRAAPRLRMLAGSVLALCAVPAYWLWVGLRVGHLDAWFVEQRQGWGTGIDEGAATGRFLLDTFRSADGFVSVAAAFIIIGTGVGVLVAVLTKVWPPFTLYGVLAYATVVGSSGYFNSRPRLLLPVLVMLVPVAFALAGARTRTRALVPAVAGMSLVGCWFGAYMITVWPYTI
jgi:hypothetical protein